MSLVGSLFPASVIVCLHRVVDIFLCLEAIAASHMSGCFVLPTSTVMPSLASVSRV